MASDATRPPQKTHTNKLHSATTNQVTNPIHNHKDPTPIPLIPLKVLASLKKSLCYQKTKFVTQKSGRIVTFH